MSTHVDDSSESAGRSGPRRSRSSRSAAPAARRRRESDRSETPAEEPAPQRRRSAARDDARRSDGERGDTGRSRRRRAAAKPARSTAKEPVKRLKSSGKKKAAARKAAKKRDRSRGAEQAASRSAAAAPLDPVAKFSASALRRVTVLGDRPSNFVYSLAEQSSNKTGTYVLGSLIGVCGVALVTLLGLLLYQLFAGPQQVAQESTPIVTPPEGHTTLLPELYHAQEQQELFDPIAERAEDAEPLTSEQVFGSTDTLTLDDVELTLQDSAVTETCTSVVWGEQLAQTLAEGACTSVARGVYQDPEGTYVAQFTLFDLADADAATAVSEELDPETSAGFVLPLNGEVEGLHKGYSQATAQVMGHYLALCWVARADGGQPEDSDSIATINVVTMDAAVSVYEQVRDAGKE
ncbi:hypothetical protein [Salinactinospora qingdaonensis]|uniref:Uncharacterized protein n=1 Tax=Salinactinospora qingdaonensis TaxID=702744 RepID=A0ABP7FNW5_9ACTN